MLCRSITTEFEGPAATFAPRNCFWGPANCNHRMSTHFTVTARKHNVPGEQLVELKRLFDSQGPDGNSRCIPRRIRFCVGKPVSPCFLKSDLCAYPSSSSAMPCCCPPAICTIFLSSKPLTGTAKHHELCDIRFRGEKHSHWARFQCQILSCFPSQCALPCARCRAGPSLHFQMRIL